jgi:hypothetical protein
MTDNYDQYIRYGEDCVKIAKQTRDPAQQVMLMHIAETWQRLADHENEKRTLHWAGTSPALFRFQRMTDSELATTINGQIEQIEWQMRAHRRVIKRNLDKSTIVEAAEAELRSLKTRLGVLKSSLKKIGASAEQVAS